jgi:hypothetical protein
MRCRSAVLLLVAAATMVTGCGQPQAYLTSSPQPAATPSPSPASPDARTLARLVPRPADLTPGYGVGPVSGGLQVTGQATLDLCAGSFPSEAKRVARNQVGVVTSAGTMVMSIEAVAYNSAAAAQQAIAELRTAQQKCPAGFVRSPTAGVPPLKYVFGPAPDGGWAPVPGETRFAVSATATDMAGHSQPQTEFFLVRGRILLGVYWRPGSEGAISGKATMESVVAFFQGRLAALPESAVS